MLSTRRAHHQRNQQVAVRAEDVIHPQVERWTRKAGQRFSRLAPSPAVVGDGGDGGVVAGIAPIPASIFIGTMTHTTSA